VIDEIKDGDSLRCAERWATATSIFGFVAMVIYAHFAKNYAFQFALLGMPIWLSYVLTGLGVIAMLPLNWSISKLSTAAYGWLIAGFLIVMAIQTVILWSFASGGFAYLSIRSSISMGVFAVIIFILPALSAWRLKVMVGRI